VKDVGITSRYAFHELSAPSLFSYRRRRAIRKFQYSLMPSQYLGSMKSSGRGQLSASLTIRTLSRGAFTRTCPASMSWVATAPGADTEASWDSTLGKGKNGEGAAVACDDGAPRAQPRDGEVLQDKYTADAVDLADFPRGPLHALS
jgi:hypothetical protein